MSDSFFPNFASPVTQFGSVALVGIVLSQNNNESPTSVKTLLISSGLISPDVLSGNKEDTCDASSVCVLLVIFIQLHYNVIVTYYYTPYKKNRPQKLEGGLLWYEAPAVRMSQEGFFCCLEQQIQFQPSHRNRLSVDGEVHHLQKPAHLA